MRCSCQLSTSVGVVPWFDRLFSLFSPFIFPSLGAAINEAPRLGGCPTFHVSNKYIPGSRFLSTCMVCRSSKTDVCVPDLCDLYDLYDLHDLAHVAGLAPYDLA